MRHVFLAGNRQNSIFFRKMYVFPKQTKRIAVSDGIRIWSNFAFISVTIDFSRNIRTGKLHNHDANGPISRWTDENGYRSFGKQLEKQLHTFFSLISNEVLKVININDDWVIELLLFRRWNTIEHMSTFDKKNADCRNNTGKSNIREVFARWNTAKHQNTTHQNKSNVYFRFHSINWKMSILVRYCLHPNHHRKRFTQFVCDMKCLCTKINGFLCGYHFIDLHRQNDDMASTKVHQLHWSDKCKLKFRIFISQYLNLLEWTNYSLCWWTFE